jgi:hypothetical protein
MKVLPAPNGVLWFAIMPSQIAFLISQLFGGNIGAIGVRPLNGRELKNYAISQKAKKDC